MYAPIIAITNRTNIPHACLADMSIICDVTQAAPTVVVQHRTAMGTDAHSVGTFREA